MTRIKFLPGEVIPHNIIVHRFKDKEFDGILLEIEGEPNHFLRVTEDNRFLFKVGKEVYPRTELEPLKTSKPRTETPPIDATLPEYLRPYVKKAYILQNENEIKLYDQNFVFLGKLPAARKETARKPSRKTDDDNVTNLGVNDRLPPTWRQICKKEKDGYSLRIGRYFFRIDPDFRILKKVMLTDPAEKEILEYDRTEQIIASTDLPEDEDLYSGKTQQSLAVPNISKTSLSISTREIVINLVEKFKKAIVANQMQLVYFVEKRLSSDRFAALQQVLKGDLAYLNDETKAGFASKPRKGIKPGFSLLKSGLVHELYINSTLADRTAGEDQSVESGRNLKRLWTFLLLIKHDGILRGLGQEISPVDQKRMISFFGTLKSRYSDKKDMIGRVYEKLLFDLENGTLLQGAKNFSIDKFKAVLIYKLYENTNKMERGDGITMICLIREIIDYKL